MPTLSVLNREPHSSPIRSTVDEHTLSGELPSSARKRKRAAAPHAEGHTPAVLFQGETVTVGSRRYSQPEHFFFNAFDDDSRSPEKAALEFAQNFGPYTPGAISGVRKMLALPEIDAFQALHKMKTTFEPPTPRSLNKALTIILNTLNKAPKTYE